MRKTQFGKFKIAKNYFKVEFQKSLLMMLSTVWRINLKWNWNSKKKEKWTDFSKVLENLKNELRLQMNIWMSKLMGSDQQFWSVKTI